MKLKNRIKRALAAFLQDELLEIIGYRHDTPYHRLATMNFGETLPFETVTMEKTIALNTRESVGIPFEFQYEEYLQELKEKFAKEVVKHIHVKTFELTDPTYVMKRAIILELRVQTKRR